MHLTGGAIVAGRFRLVRELGRGGMGAVWLAHDASLDTPCAIKFIHAEAAQSTKVRARFEREAKSAAQLRSPNVVQILDHGVSEGTPYIAMEYLEGEDLEQRLGRMGRLGPAETVAIVSQVARALTRASAAGLVHRDLKPANIFLVRDEDHDLAKVLDFGVAKSNMPGLDGATKTGSMLGTPYYMSPEQTRGTKDLDHRSDLWALAVIVFQCVTGRLPFLGESLGDLLFRIAGDPLPVPSQVAPDLPPAFDAWWARAARRDPAERFQTARELVDALALAFGFAQRGVSAGSSEFPGAPSVRPFSLDPATIALPALSPSASPQATAILAPEPTVTPGASTAGLASSAAVKSKGSARGAVIAVIAALGVAGVGWAAYAKLGRQGAASEPIASASASAIQPEPTMTAAPSAPVGAPSAAVAPVASVEPKVTLPRPPIGVGSTAPRATTRPVPSSSNHEMTRRFE
jgi:serine/threonine-protein kinase